MRILPEIVRRCGQSAPKYRPLQAAGRSWGAGARSSSRSKGGCSGGITISSVSRGRSDCTRRVIASHFASMSVHFMAQFLLMRGAPLTTRGERPSAQRGGDRRSTAFFWGQNHCPLPRCDSDADGMHVDHPKIHGSPLLMGLHWIRNGQPNPLVPCQCCDPPSLCANWKIGTITHQLCAIGCEPIDTAPVSALQNGNFLEPSCRANGLAVP